MNEHICALWQRTEQIRGVYDFAWLGDQVDALRAQGISPILCLTGENPLYAPDDTLAALREPAAWARHVAALVRFLDGRVTRYAVDNDTLDVAAYGAFALHTAHAVKTTCPQAHVCLIVPDGLVMTKELVQVTDAIRCREADAPRLRAALDACGGQHIRLVSQEAFASS